MSNISSERLDQLRSWGKQLGQNQESNVSLLDQIFWEKTSAGEETVVIQSITKHLEKLVAYGEAIVSSQGKAVDNLITTWLKYITRTQEVWSSPLDKFQYVQGLFVVLLSQLNQLMKYPVEKQRQEITTQMKEMIMNGVGVRSVPLRIGTGRHAFIRAIIESAGQMPITTKDALDIVRKIYQEFFADISSLPNGQTNFEGLDLPKLYLVLVSLFRAGSGIQEMDQKSVKKEGSDKVNGSLSMLPLSIYSSLLELASESMAVSLQPLLVDVTVRETPLMMNASSGVLEQVGSGNVSGSNSSKVLFASASLVTQITDHLATFAEVDGSQQVKTLLMHMEEDLRGVGSQLVEVMSRCVSAVLELGTAHESGEEILGVITGVAGLACRVFGICGRLGIAIDDMGKLREVVLQAARLTEAAATSAEEARSSGAGSAPSIQQLWLWDLCEDLSSTGIVARSRKNALTLSKAVVEGYARALVASWKGNNTGVVRAELPTGAIVTNFTHSAEMQIMCLALGRFYVLMNGNPEIGMLILPPLMDSLVLNEDQLKGVGGDVYACIVHVLAHIGACNAGNRQDDDWVYKQVMNAYFTMYKQKQNPASRRLMFSAVKPEDGDEPWLGSIANAIDTLALKLSKASMVVRRDFHQSLLQLFSDFAATGSLQAHIIDLGHLLPAIADASEGVSSIVSGPLVGMSIRSFDALQKAYESEFLILRLYRNFWLYCGLYDFANMGQTSRSGSSRGLANGTARVQFSMEWSVYLGRIAAKSPVFIVPGGQHKMDEVDQRLSVEWLPRLQHVGDRGQLHSIIYRLNSILGSTESEQTHSLLDTSKALVIAMAEVSRAALAPLIEQGECPPIGQMLAFLQVCDPKSPLFLWYKHIIRKVYSVFVNRLKNEEGMKLGQPVYTQTGNAYKSTESLAIMLIENLETVVGRDALEAVTLTEELLNDLLYEQFPFLYYSKKCIGSLFDSLEYEIGGQRGFQEFVPRSKEDGQAWKWIQKWFENAGKRAPGRTEAILHNFFNASSVSYRPAAARRAAEMLKAIHDIGALGDTRQTGVSALERKTLAIGALRGLNELAENDNNGDVVKKVVNIISEKFKNVKIGGSQKSLEDSFALVAAALVTYQDSDSAVIEDLIKYLCWIPVHQLDEDTMRVAVMAWHWIVTGSNSNISVQLMSEMLDSWLQTTKQQLGIFSQRGQGEFADGDEELVQQIRGQHLWLGFLIEHWETVSVNPSPNGQVEAKILQKLFASSIHTLSQGACYHPAATGAIFRLLYLALRSVRHVEKYCKQQEASQVMLHNTLMAALRFFSHNPTHFGRWRVEEAKDVRTALAAFFRLLQQLQRSYNEEQLTLNFSQEFTSSKYWQLPSDPKDFINRVDLLLFLCEHELNRLEVWQEPLTVQAKEAPKQTAAQWKEKTQTAWKLHPSLALALRRRFLMQDNITNTIQENLMSTHEDPEIRSMPEMASILASLTQLKTKSMDYLDSFEYWTNCSAIDALVLISSKASRYTQVKQYALRSLELCADDEVVFFLPQLVQALRYDSDGLVEQFLRGYAAMSDMFLHLLIWALKSEGRPPESAMDPVVKRSGWKPPKDTGLWDRCDKLREQLEAELSKNAKDYLEAEVGFFDSVTKVSGELYQYSKEERKVRAVEYLKKLPQPQRTDLYIPTNPSQIVESFIPESGTPMQSAAKVPILVAFNVENQETSSAQTQALIFKVGDDCRQDVLALQVISLIKREFERIGLQLYLKDYGVVPTGYEQGIIQVVGKSKSRDALGDMYDTGLYDIFVRQYGMPGSEKFEQARYNFIVSQAGYAVASYILQAKDRHNGNILIMNDGHLVHIDFGFILEISPAGNLKFERAAFKLSHEMTQLLDPGQQKKSTTYKLFQELVIRGYLVARQIAEGIIATTLLMEDSGLPCFGHGKPIPNLRARFHMDQTDSQVVAFMLNEIDQAYNNWRTGFYDYIQVLQNDINR